jgi:hypothetical protein
MKITFLTLSKESNVMNAENLEKERDQLPPFELQAIKEMIDRLDSLSNSEEELETMRIALKMTSSKQRRAAKLTSLLPNKLNDSLGDKLRDITFRIFELKKTLRDSHRRLADATRELFQQIAKKANKGTMPTAFEKALFEAAGRIAAVRQSEQAAECAPEPEMLEDSIDTEDVPSRLRIRILATERLLDEPSLDAVAVAKYFGSDASSNPRQYAMEQRKRGTLLGVKVKGKYLYPAFQFDVSRQEVYPIIKEVNRILSSDSDPWAVLSWWTSPNGRLAGNVAPKLVLSDPKMHVILKNIAESVVEDVG